MSYLGPLFSQQESSTSRLIIAQRYAERRRVVSVTRQHRARILLDTNTDSTGQAQINPNVY